MPSSIRSSAFGTATVSSSVRAPRAPRTLRVSAGGPHAAEHPGAGGQDGGGLVPDRRFHERARGPVERVLSTPGIDELSSGRRDQDRIRLTQRALQVLDRERLLGRDCRRRRRTAESPSTARTARCRRRRARRRQPPGAAPCYGRRPGRLPLIARIFIGLGLHQREVGGDGDVVGQCRLAARQVHLPVDAEVAAVHGGLDIEAEPLGAEPSVIGPVTVPAISTGS